MKFLFSLTLIIFCLTNSLSQTSGEIYANFIANKSNPEKALGLAKNGFSTAKLEGNNRLAGIFAFELAKLHQKSGDNASGIEQSLIAESYFKKENDDNSLKINKFLLFDLYRKSSKEKAAIAVGKELMSIVSGVERCKLELDLANVYFVVKDYSKTISTLEIRAANCPTGTELKSLELLGIAYNNYGNHNKAKETFDMGLKLSIKEGNGNMSNRFNELLNGANNNAEIKGQTITNFDRDLAEEKENYVTSVKQNSDQLFVELSKLSKDLQINKLKLLYVEQEYEKNKLRSAIKLQRKESALQLKTAENKKQKATIELNKANLRNKKQTIWYLSLFIVMAVIGTLLLFRNYKRQKALNEQLNIKNNQIIEQSEVIVAQNKKLDSSIDYGRFIQNQLLPTTKGFKKLFDNSFELQIPLDKLSGDFLWYKEMNGIKYVCLVDCTGHGVPGAILSIIANVVLEKAIKMPFNNLQELMESIAFLFYSSFRRQSEDSNDEEIFEGMDLCLVAIDETNKQFKVTSANNSAILVSKGSIQELRTSKASFNANNNSIKTEELRTDYSQGDYLYLYTDGFCDQKGGPENRKFGKTKTLELIKSLSGKDVNIQKFSFQESLNIWQGNNKQIDDISIIGIKL